MISDEDFSAGSSDIWQPSSGEDAAGPHQRRRQRPHGEANASGDTNSSGCEDYRPLRRRRHPRGQYSRASHETKNMLVELYEEGLSIVEAARRTKVKISTARSIVKRYKQDGIIDSDRRGGRKEKKLTEQVLIHIENIVEKNNAITLKNIVRQLREDHNVALSKSTVHNGLCALKITLKLAAIEMAQMNAPRTLELRKRYALDFPNWATQARDKLIFIDECGFNMHLRRSQARSRRGTRARVTVPTVRGRNVTLVAAITSQGVFHTKIFANSTCNSNKFCMFLTELVDKVADTPMHSGFLVMDNAQIHKTQEVRNVVQPSDLTIKFLPPYSPMLNPIEKAFSKVKAHARQVLSDITRDHNITQVIEESVAEVTQNDCANYVMDMVLSIPQAASGVEMH